MALWGYVFEGKASAYAEGSGETSPKRREGGPERGAKRRAKTREH